MISELLSSRGPLIFMYIMYVSITFSLSKRDVYFSVYTILTHLLSVDRLKTILYECLYLNINDWSPQRMLYCYRVSDKFCLKELSAKRCLSLAATEASFSVDFTRSWCAMYYWIQINYAININKNAFYFKPLMAFPSNTKLSVSTVCGSSLNS